MKFKIAPINDSTPPSKLEILDSLGKFKEDKKENFKRLQFMIGLDSHLSNAIYVNPKNLKTAQLRARKNIKNLR
ncbi:unnamed protein product [Ambrosiozyma monospora]|uniref:Unnamed protein product n=1 Tax=Ambrosiozyma monospora TaxID=43982 RepID=A0A9W7DIG0_AMBMO|nr:unnamed protein product [Ambrosiozyma monospora]